MTLHTVKIWPTFFPMVQSGAKPFEVRRNHRRYQEGDILLLREWSPGTEEYTGRETRKLITYVLAGGQFGVEQGYVVLGLKPVGL